MVRAPCCDQVWTKKGPWTHDEDQILINYVNLHGHSNWRALPKQAGLLRCGKSCRLRWVNYLRPDIKRGNLSKEEEETVIRLHRSLGNRWCAIEAQLPGRTDNEIKNLWYTRIKKNVSFEKEVSNNEVNVTVAVVLESNGLALASVDNEEEDILSNMVLDFIVPKSPKCLSVIGNSSTTGNDPSDTYSGDLNGFSDDFWLGGIH